MKNILNIEREIHLYQDLYHEHVTIYLELQIRKKHSVQIQYYYTMEQDRAANQRSAFSLFFTLALYIIDLD